jgi:8-amino-7-oxononanoate synthase
MNRWYGEMEKELEDLREKGQFRFLRNIEGKVGKSIRAEGKDYLNFSSNDYLGIASNKELHKEFYENLREGNILDNYGLSSASSRLLTGNSFHYGLLEKELASFFRREAALVFNSGYHANTGILPALLGPDDFPISSTTPVLSTACS